MVKRICRAFSVLLAVLLLVLSLPASAEEDAVEWKQISAGWFHTLGLKKDGTLWAWGSNNFCQLGTDDHNTYYLPQKVMDDVIWADAGESQSLAIKTDGSLWVWGSNDLDQLGLGGDVTECHAPTKLMDGVSMAWTNYTHSMALKRDGTLWAWGDNSTGQLGAGDTARHEKPMKVLEGVQSAAVGCFHSAAVLRDGSLWMWGANEDAQLGMETTDENRITARPVRVMEGIRSVALSEKFSCAVSVTGELYVWGNNSDGQLVTGDTEPVTAPRQVAVSVRDVQAGRTHIAVLTASGEVYTCGNNFHGQVGDATSIDSHSLTKVLENVSSVSCHCDHTFAIGADGAYGWGAGYYGQFGNGTGMDFFSPRKFTGEPLETPESLPGEADVSRMVSTFAAGFSHNLAILENGDLYAWGSNEKGELGTGVAGGSSVPVKVLPNVRTVAAGDCISFAVDEDNVLWGWGDNSKGQMGLAAESSVILRPEKILEDTAGVFCGTYHVMAVKTDGSLWVWGDNSKGQLGVGSTAECGAPVRLMDGVCTAAAGSYHSIAVREDGSVWMWGNCDYGQLGFGSDTGTGVPLRLRSTDIASASAGEIYSAVLTEGGTLYMWGDNTNGQIGNFTQSSEAEANKYTDETTAGDSSDLSQQGNTTIYSPIQVLTGVRTADLGLSHTLAVKNDGTLLAWGLGTAGQLGKDHESTKEPRKLDERVVEARGGGLHTLYLKADGTLWGVGNNSTCQLGYPVASDAEESEVLVRDPVKILSGVKFSDSARSFRDNELKLTFAMRLAAVPAYVWIIAVGSLLIAGLAVWVVISQLRIRRLREAAVTAVSQVRELRKEQERLLSSRGTQRRRPKNEERK